MNKELLQQYKDAIYVIEDQGHKIVLEHAGKHAESDLLLERYRATLAAFITPENPFSIVLSNEQNALRHEQFKEILKERNLHFLTGYGTDVEGKWGKEISYLIMIKDKATSDELSKVFGQNAYLVVSKGYAPMLRCMQPIKYKDL